MGWTELVRPVRYGAVNAAWQMRGDEALIRFCASFVDVMGVVEARRRDGTPVDIGRILGDGTTPWRAYQDTRDGSRSGSAVAVWACSVLKPRRTRMWVTNKAGAWRDPVGKRWARIVHVKDHGVRTVVITAHAATINSGEHDESLAEIRKIVRHYHDKGLRWILLADVNTGPAEYAYRIGARDFHADDVMLVAWGARTDVQREGKGWGRMKRGVRHHDSTDHGIPWVEEISREKAP